MIFAFVIDSSASMNQMASNGMTLLDCAKAGVEHFLKLRGRDQISFRRDVFLLVTCEEGLAAIKAGRKSPFPVFLNELKNLTAKDISNIGPALKTTFDLVNQFRIQNNVDNYGMGRIPWLIEPSIIILLTAGNLTCNEGMLKNLSVPIQPMLAGSELTIEPFRWDQRLFSLVLRFPAYNNSVNNNINIPQTKICEEDAEQTALMCRVTGGKCHQVGNMRELLQAIEMLVNKSHPGVVVNFEKLPIEIKQKLPPKQIQQRSLPHKPINEFTSSDDLMILDDDVVMKDESNNNNNNNNNNNGEENIYESIPSTALYKFLICRTTAGFWPFPEPYPIDHTLSKLRPRNSQPHIYFSPIDCDPHILTGFPFDKYPVEQCELTDWMLEHKKKVCWRTYVPSCSPKDVYRPSADNSSSISSMEPFGFIKASSTHNTVNLFVLPYNFPKLWSLLDDLVTVHKKIPNPKWRQEFEVYINSIPFYYYQPLRKALKTFGINSNLIPDHLDGILPVNVSQYLKKLKAQSKVETDRMQSNWQQAKDAQNQSKKTMNMKIKSIFENSSPSPSNQNISPNSNANSNNETSWNFHQLLEKGSLSSDQNGSGSSSTSSADFTDSSMPIMQPQFKNVFDLPRNQLLDQIQRIRAHVFVRDSIDPSSSLTPSSSSSDLEMAHQIPIAQMGNYQDALNKREILRSLTDDDDLRKRPIFGNPYRNDKTAVGNKMGDNIIDEAENDNTTNNEKSNEISKKKIETELTSSEAANPLISELFSNPKGDNAASSPSKAPSSPSSPSPSSPSSPSFALSIDQKRDGKSSFSFGNFDLPKIDQKLRKFEVQQIYRTHNNQFKLEVIKLIRMRVYPNVVNPNEILSKILGNASDKKDTVHFCLEQAKRYNNKYYTDCFQNVLNLLSK